MSSCTRVCQLSCGDHGTCNPCTGECDCDTDWNGTLCQTPSAGVKCKPSDAAFQKKHGGDKDCGNYGSYGKCNADGSCTCTNKFYGSRCERGCDTDNQCGGSQQSRPIGLCNSFSQCECKSGWSGVQCTTPPSNQVECAADEDCGWGGQINGKCQSNKRCKCNTDSAHGGRVMFDGPFCEKLVQYEGATCLTDKDCKGGNKCHRVGNKMVCYTPDESPASKRAHLEEIVNSLFTLENLVLMFGQGKAEEMAAWMASKAVGSAVTVGVELKNLMLDEAEQLVTKDALESMTKYLPEAMAARVVARMVGKEAIERTASMATKVVAEELVTSLFGAVFSIAGLFQQFGMVLDMFDSRGLNQQMLQSMLDQQQRGFDTFFNRSEEAVNKLLFVPRAVSPTESVLFNTEMQSKAIQSKKYEDAAKYLSLLRVNSNGDMIVPLFTSLAAQQMEDKRSKYKVYWSMARGNDDVFNKLVKYGWMFWVLLSLLVISMVLIAVFSSKSVQAKLRK